MCAIEGIAPVILQLGTKWRFKLRPVSSFGITNPLVWDRARSIAFFFVGAKRRLPLLVIEGQSSSPSPSTYTDSVLNKIQSCKTWSHWFKSDVVFSYFAGNVSVSTRSGQAWCTILFWSSVLWRGVSWRPAGVLQSRQRASPGRVSRSLLFVRGHRVAALWFAIIVQYNFTKRTALEWSGRSLCDKGWFPLLWLIYLKLSLIRHVNALFRET